jgi:nicotinate-nucleotide adenylyltransferase
VTETLNGPRIGAYGGTFDPPHNGHIEVARAIIRNFRLDELLVIPAHRPPHKQKDFISEAHHRYSMAVIATLDEPRLKVSAIEIESPDRPYTFETVEQLRQLYGRAALLFFVMGADSFVEINTWREPERLFSATNIIVAARPGVEVVTTHLTGGGRNVRDLRGRAGEAYGEGAADDDCCSIYLTDYVSKDISSTEIRRRVREGMPINELVPAPVARYIEKYELYRR